MSEGTETPDLPLSPDVLTSLNGETITFDQVQYGDLIAVHDGRSGITMAGIAANRGDDRGTGFRGTVGPWFTPQGAALLTADDHPNRVIVLLNRRQELPEPPFGTTVLARTIPGAPLTRFIRVGENAERRWLGVPDDDHVYGYPDLLPYGYLRDVEAVESA